MNYTLIMLSTAILVCSNGCGTPKKKESHYDKAMMAIEDGDIKQALMHLDKELIHSPLPQYYALKGTLHYQIQEFKESKKTFKQLLNNKQLPPALRAEVLNNYACVLNQMGQPVEAQMLWQQLTSNRDYPTKEVAWFNLGMLALHDSKKMMRCSVPQSQKLARVAIKRFTQALTLEPEYIDAQFYLSQAYLLNNQQKPAQGSLKKLLALNPNHVGAQQLLTKNYAAQDLI